MPDHVANPVRTRLAAPHIPAGERAYAIGDVHGRLDLLERLIAMIRDDAASRPPAAVRLILLGDIIDRGPASAMLVDRCRMLAERTDRFVVLKGNHEAMLVHAVRGSFPALSVWLRNGGDAALRSWGVPDDAIADGDPARLMMAARRAIPEDVVDWLDALPLTLECGDYLFVHAGIRPDVALAAQADEDLLWIRNEFLESASDHGRMIVHGHSIDAAGIVVRPNRIGIDTGAYRTGALTALGLEGDRRWTIATAASDA